MSRSRTYDAISFPPSLSLAAISAARSRATTLLRPPSTAHNLEGASRPFRLGCLRDGDQPGTSLAAGYPVRSTVDDPSIAASKSTNSRFFPLLYFSPCLPLSSSLLFFNSFSLFVSLSLSPVLSLSSTRTFRPLFQLRCDFFLFLCQGSCNFCNVQPTVRNGTASRVPVRYRAIEPIVLSTVPPSRFATADR